MSSWSMVSLSDLGDVSRGKSKHRPRNDASLYGGDYPFIQTGDVKEANFYINNYTQTYNEKGLKQSKLWEKDTLCITIAANIAESALLSFPACFPDSIVGFTPYEGVSDVRYVKYLLDNYKAEFQKRSKGATQDNLSVDKINALKVKVPDYSLQVKIADIISTYDYLIENNQKRIQILEEMVQRLYEQWFVKFKFPGHKNVKFVNSSSELGIIPETWKVDDLSKQVSYLEGPGIRNWQYRDFGIRFLNIRTMNNGDILLDKCNYLDQVEVQAKYSHFLLNEGDIVVSSSGTLGRNVIIRKSHLPICLNTSIIRYREVSGGLPKSYIWPFLNSSYFQNKIQSLASGSAQLNYGPSHLDQIRVIVPEVEIIEKYDSIVKTTMEEIGITRDKNSKLTLQRDFIKSGLISGNQKLKY